MSWLLLLCWFAADCARAAELHVPQDAVAGQPLSIGTSGSGTLYLIGPGQVIKRAFKSGGNVEIKGEELRGAGRWIAVVRGDGNQSQVFWVKPGKPEKLNFLARPSRVPVARPNVISGVTFVFDRYQNLILDPTPVNFNLSVGGAGSSKSVTSRDGVAWINSSSAPKAGAAQFVTTVGDTAVRRVVQQVAADPCNLRMHVAGPREQQGGGRDGSHSRLQRQPRAGRHDCHLHPDREERQKHGGRAHQERHSPRRAARV